MAVLVDYACPTCNGRTEARVPSPPPRALVCPSCGGEANRVWSPVGLLRRPQGGVVAGAMDAGTVAPEASPSGGHTTRPLCVDNPDVPGLCHMTPSAGRAWLARARGDNRSLEQELARQEAAAVTSPPTLDAVVSHHHHPPTHHHDGSGHHHDQNDRHRTPGTGPSGSP